VLARTGLLTPLAFGDGRLRVLQVQACSLLRSQYASELMPRVLASDFDYATVGRWAVFMLISASPIGWLIAQGYRANLLQEALRL